MFHVRLFPKKGGNPIDILNLVDRLEELLDRGMRLPFGKVAIEEEACLNIIDQMRISIPQEIKRAKEIQDERDKYVAQANEEARRIIAQAREDAAKLLDEHKLREAAEAQAEAILKRAQEDAARVRQAANEYVAGKLEEFSQQLAKLQLQVQNGLEILGRPAQREEGARPGQAAETANTKPSQDAPADTRAPHPPEQRRR